MATEKNKPISFIEQAFAIIEENYSNDNGQEHGMKIADHKLLCRVLDAHEGYINDVIIQKFVEKIAEHYTPIMKKLESLEKGQELIALDISDIKGRLEYIEDKVETDETRIKRIEEWVKNRKDLEERIINIEKNTGHIYDWSNLPEPLEQRFNKIEAYKPKFERLERLVSPYWSFLRMIIAAIIGASIVGFITIEVVKHLHSAGKLVGYFAQYV